MVITVATLTSYNRETTMFVILRLLKPITATWEIIQGLGIGVKHHGTTVVKSKFVSHFLDELSYHRAIANWLMLFLYIWIVVYSVKHYPDTVTTAITVTGGLCTAIFTNYVWSRYMDGKNGNNKDTGVSPSGQVSGQADGQKPSETTDGAI
jgi:hypothetical protein